MPDPQGLPLGPMYPTRPSPDAGPLQGRALRVSDNVFSDWWSLSGSTRVMPFFMDIAPASLGVPWEKGDLLALPPRLYLPVREETGCKDEPCVERVGGVDPSRWKGGPK